MKDRVTIVPSDYVVIVDGEGIFFDYAAPTSIHAIQWYNGSGHIEYTDGTFNKELVLSDYEKEVLPYVELWEVEKAKQIVLEPEEEPEQLTLEQIVNNTIKQYEQNIQNYMDTFARTRYDNMNSACSYYNSSNPVWKAEAEYCVNARDAIWEKAFELLNYWKSKALAGEQLPSWEEIKSQLPVLEWPVERK